LGVTQEVLTVLLKFQANLQGIELGHHQLFIKLHSDAAVVLDQMKQQLARVSGILNVEPVALLPGEREHQELLTLLACYPEAVVSVNREGDILAASDAFYHYFGDHLQDSGSLLSVITQTQLNDIMSSMQSNSSQQYSLVIRDKSLLLETFPLVSDGMGNEAEGSDHEVMAALLVFKEPSQVAAQLERWQRSKDLPFEAIIAHSDAMKHTLREAEQMALLDAPLLIEGETGTGKELLARATHLKRTPDKPFLALNCASLPDNVAEHELFGYGAGAFEGALETGKPGLLELADGGTLYFDEIGEMSPYLQVKLLRFLEEGAFRRVGTDQEVKVKVKVIASTQQDLKQLCANKRFREDLYYRLHVLNLKLLPLRKRKADINPLADYFITTACQRIGRDVCELTQRARTALNRYNWPGNVRELENIIFRAVSVSTSEQITTRQLNMPMLKSMVSDLNFDQSELSHKELMLAFERQLFEYLYPSYPSSRKLAKKLGLSHTAVANKLREFGLTS
jgi:transcriptional regulator of aroF, aroG, tyrA and aromatic amino acid transport